MNNYARQPGMRTGNMVGQRKCIGAGFLLATDSSAEMLNRIGWLRFEPMREPIPTASTGAGLLGKPWAECVSFRVARLPESTPVPGHFLQADLSVPTRMS